MKKFFTTVILIFLVGCSNTKEKSSKIERKEYIFLKGLNLYQKGKKREALKEYKKLYEIDSENIVLLKEMGMIYFELGDNKNSMEFLKKVEELSPKDDIIKKNISIVYYSMGEIEKAEKYIESISKSSIDEDTFKIKGYIAFEKNEYQQAYEYLKNGIPEFYQERYYLILQESMLNLKKEKELYNLLNEVYKKYYMDREFIDFYCNSLSEIFDEKALAIRVMLRYISEYGGEDKDYLLLSKLYLENGERENALNSFKLISKGDIFNEEYIILKNRIVDINGDR